MSVCCVCVCMHVLYACVSAQCTHVGEHAHDECWARMCVQVMSSMCMLYGTRCPYC